MSSGTFPFAADVTDPASVNKALAAIESQLGEFSGRQSHFGAKFKFVTHHAGDIHTVVYNAGNGVFGSYTRRAS